MGGILYRFEHLTVDGILYIVSRRQISFYYFFMSRRKILCYCDFLVGQQWKIYLRKNYPLLSTLFQRIPSYLKVLTRFNFVIRGILVCLTRWRDDYVSLYRKETDFESKCHLKASTKTSFIYFNFHFCGRKVDLIH